MPQRIATGFLARFWSGTTLGALNGFIVFRWNIFRPDQSAFDCLVGGAVMAGILSVVRLSAHGHAIALALTYGAFRMVQSPGARWSAGISGLLLGLGGFLVAVIYDELARYGLRFGKFLIVGPLLGGIYLAVAPISELGNMTMFNAVHPLILQLALGIVIGEGVALGVELAELVFHFTSRRSESGGALS